MDYLRQSQIYNPEEQQSEIIIIGAGSTGSFTALNLAKMGVSKIKVIDFDKVEEHNIPNQFFRLSDVGKFKVEALKEIIQDFTGTEIEAENIEIKEDYEFEIGLNTIIILCVDSIEARKLIYNKIKDFPIKILDTRMGGEGFSLHVVDLDNEEDKKKYEESLDLETKETACGEKAIIYTILSIASETCNIVKMIDKGEQYPKIVRRELKQYRFIAK